MERLKELRKNAKLTQVQLAEKAGVDHSTIAKIERGQRGATRAMISRVAKALSVSEAALFNSDEDYSQVILMIEQLPGDLRPRAIRAIQAVLESYQGDDDSPRQK